MQALIYFLLVAGLFVVAMRYGCGAHVLGHRHGHTGAGPRTSGSNINSREDRDPVCGMTVDTAKALSSVHAGRTYYFCSVTCRDRFQASPEKFIGTSKGSASPMEERHASHNH